MFNDNFCIITKKRIYSQRTPHSKFIEFDLNGAKIKSYDKLPEDIQEIVDISNQMEEKPENYFDYEKVNGEIEITYIYRNKSPYIKIPEYIEGLPVTKIGYNASDSIRYSVTQIHLPKTIKELDKNSFKRLESLKYINIPESVTKIPESCFMGCTNLFKINLEHVTDIDKYAFAYCNSLKNIKLKNIKKLAPSSFKECKHLEELSIFGEITKIPVNCFEDCIALEKLILGDQIEIIGDYAFRNCNIKTFYAPQNLTSINSHAFELNQIESIYLNKDLQNIQAFAFNTNENCKIHMQGRPQYDKRAFPESAIFMGNSLVR